MSFSSSLVGRQDRTWRNRLTGLIGVQLLLPSWLNAEIDLAIITGGAGGLGKELTSMLVNSNIKVIVLDLYEPTTVDSIMGAKYYACDVSKKSQVDDIVNEIKIRYGPPTILINNAGVMHDKTIMNLTYKEVKKTINVNLLSSFITIKALLPDMLENKRGYIITIGSVLGHASPAKLSAYGASKSGLIALHESLTYELGGPLSGRETGVNTLLVSPGQLNTSLFKSVRTPSQLLAPVLEPRYVASRVFRAMNRNQVGELKLPFYVQFMPFLRAMPWPIAMVARSLSGMDSAVK